MHLSTSCLELERQLRDAAVGITHPRPSAVHPGKPVTALSERVEPVAPVEKLGVVRRLAFRYSKQHRHRSQGLASYNRLLAKMGKSKGEINTAIASLVLRCIQTVQERGRA